jgi:hypothetical protein
MANEKRLNLPSQTSPRCIPLDHVCADEVLKGGGVGLAFEAPACKAQIIASFHARNWLARRVPCFCLGRAEIPDMFFKMFTALPDADHILF